MQQRKVFLIWGKVGSGKTTLGKKILARFPRVVIFDTLHEYHGTIVKTFPDFLDLAQAMHDKPFTIICRYMSNLEYEYTAKAIRELGNCLVVLEEVEAYLSSYEKDTDNPINWLISFGRHVNVSILGIGRTVTEIPKKLRAQFTSITTFVQTEPSDLAYLELQGFDPEEVSTLDKFAYITVGEPLGGEQQTNDNEASQTEDEVSAGEV